jgi:hypothetical protein
MDDKRLKSKRLLIHRLLFKLGIMESKRGLLEQYNVRSTTELSPTQLDDLIMRLQKGLNNRQTPNNELKKWRSNALVWLNHCGIYANNSDWTRVNEFMLNPRVCGKLLYELDVDELKKVVVKLRAIADKKRADDKKRLYKNISMN